jgi:two-component system CheB/CheR fusion protein
LFNYSLCQEELGPAETISRNNEGFDILDTKLKLYKRTKVLASKQWISKFFSNKKAVIQEIITHF